MVNYSDYMYIVHNGEAKSAKSTTGECIEPFAVLNTHSSYSVKNQ